MSDINQLDLRCRACGNAALPEQKVLDDFELLAYDEIIGWSDFTGEVPDVDEKVWLRSEAIPSKGETRIVKAYFPFNFVIGKKGEEIWVLFRPAKSYLNGWDSYPQEIESSAIVKIKPMDMLSRSKYEAWINIIVEDVIPLNEMCNRFSAKEPAQKECWPCWDEFPKLPELKYGSFSLYSWNVQGDIGGWYLTTTDGTGIEHLLLYSEWSFHYDNVYCGNIILR